jgi:hypothetical protein
MIGRFWLLALALSTATARAAMPASQEVPRVFRDNAVATIARLGGTWRADSALAGAPIVRVDLHASAVADSDLTVLAGLPHLRHLDLRLTTVGDSGVARLRGLRELTFVNLFRTRTGDRGLAGLFQSAGIETLLIGGTKVTDDGLAGLRNLPNLRRLSLFDTAVSDAGLAHLAGHRKLETVLTTKSKVTPEGQAALLKALPNVRFSEN